LCEDDVRPGGYFFFVSVQGSGGRSASPALLLTGVVLVAINLRPAAASVGPLLHRIQVDTGLSNGWAGAFTALPVLCFGLLAPAAPILAKRLGAHATIAIAMSLLLAGQLARLIPGVGFSSSAPLSRGRRSQSAMSSCPCWYAEISPGAPARPCPCSLPG
jgi:hypothetical protein